MPVMKAMVPPEIPGTRSAIPISIPLKKIIRKLPNFEIIGLT
tara:strand:- start:5488 stop:5613 length:126 start_codon:yes stop_codon:yes gene_type:complete